MPWGIENINYSFELYIILTHEAYTDNNLGFIDGIGQLCL